MIDWLALICSSLIIKSDLGMDLSMASDGESESSSVAVLSNSSRTGKQKIPVAKRSYKRKRNAESLATRLKRYIDETNSRDCITTDGKVLTCTVCECGVGCKQLGQVKEHLETNKHKDSKRRKTERASETNKRQERIADFINKRSNAAEANEFYRDTTAAFQAADIALEKLRNDTLKRYLEKYTGKHVPDPSTLRKAYTDFTHDATIEKIRKELANEYVFIQVDETQIHGLKVAHLLAGKMDSNGPGRAFLLACEVLHKTTSETIAQFVNEAMHVLWPARVAYDHVLLLVSDAAAYMKAAYNALKVLYPKMLHITCLAHGLHNVCEKIRYAYPALNGLIADVKSVFLKAPNRVSQCVN